MMIPARLDVCYAAAASATSLALSNGTRHASDNGESTEAG
jgi:hypothetical protein